MICLTYIYYSICVREMQGEILGCLHKFLGAPQKGPFSPLRSRTKIWYSINRHQSLKAIVRISTDIHFCFHWSRFCDNIYVAGEKCFPPASSRSRETAIAQAAASRKPHRRRRQSMSTLVVNRDSISGDVSTVPLQMGIPS